MRRGNVFSSDDIMQFLCISPTRILQHVFISNFFPASVKVQNE